MIFDLTYRSLYYYSLKLLRNLYNKFIKHLKIFGLLTKSCFFLSGWTINFEPEDFFTKNCKKLNNFTLFLMLDSIYESNPGLFWIVLLNISRFTKIQQNFFRKKYFLYTMSLVRAFFVRKEVFILGKRCSTIFILWAYSREWKSTTAL